MPAANNLQDGTLIDKQGPTGKSLSTCILHTTSNSTMCIPHLLRERHCDYLISDLPAAATQNLSKRGKKKQIWLSILSTFPPCRGLWGVWNSRLKQTLDSSLRNQLQSHLFCTLPMILWQKSFFLLCLFIKKVGRSKVNDCNWILGLSKRSPYSSTERLAISFTVNTQVLCTHSSSRTEGVIITSRFFPEKVCFYQLLQLGESYPNEMKTYFTRRT